MNKLMLVIGACIIVAACAGAPSAEQSVYALRSGYDAGFLAPAAAYNELPRCPQTTPVCSEQKVVDRLREADDLAHKLLDDAEAIVRGQAQGDATAATKAAHDAVDAANAVLATYNIKALVPKEGA